VAQEEVASHIRNLAALGWIDVEPSKDLPVEDPDLVADAA